MLNKLNAGLVKKGRGVEHIELAAVMFNTLSWERRAFDSASFFPSYCSILCCSSLAACTHVGLDAGGAGGTMFGP
eukprot:5490608-Amphidinium_carterae.3